MTIGLIGLLMNELVLLVGTHWLHWFYLHSKLLATTVVLGWNFGARKVILFAACPAIPPSAKGSVHETRML